MIGNAKYRVGEIERTGGRQRGREMYRVGERERERERKERRERDLAAHDEPGTTEYWPQKKHGCCIQVSLSLAKYFSLAWVVGLG